MFKDKNVLITGGKGMVGRALTKLVEKESPNHITIADLPDYDLCQSKESLINWARRQKLKYLIFPFETVGNKYFMTSEFIRELRSHNIESIFHMRDWDKYAFPFASKGFFPFKKNISALLLRNKVI